MACSHLGSTRTLNRQRKRAKGSRTGISGAQLACPARAPWEAVPSDLGLSSRQSTCFGAGHPSQARLERRQADLASHCPGLCEGSPGLLFMLGLGTGQVGPRPGGEGQVSVMGGWECQDLSLDTMSWTPP